MYCSFDNLKSFYENKNILITGHTGFKGSWLSLFLNYLNANILGISLNKMTNHSKSGFAINEVHEIISDVNDVKNYSKQIKKFNPDIIFYLAAQPIVRKAFKDPIETFKSNVFGLIQFLNFIKSYSHNIKTILVVTSDKVYDYDKTKTHFSEDDKLGGVEPYGASKAIQEIISKCFYESYFKYKTRLITVRAGNVLGGGDWNSDRLVVDIINSIITNKEMQVRYPNNTRPWQYILDLIYGYLSLVVKASNEKNNYFDSFNFAPNKSLPALDIINAAKNYWGKRFSFNLNYKKKFIFEEPKLSIDSEKIFNYIGWRNENDLPVILEKTFSWYDSYLKDQNMLEFNMKMIKEFFQSK